MRWVAVRDALLLTPREADVVELALTGMTDKQIARALKISYGSVKTHIRAAYQTLGVNSRIELAARIAQRAGIDLRAAFNVLRRRREAEQSGIRG